ncbi:hypothetical protein ASE73_08110 [Sphingomonas sp. Leaf24]|uniref:molybdenum cofactor guanylyltransferase n=1 Tax=unclassified Sphingomonas TaxID=196159 RepID=UPI0006FCFC82|nr:MULTISPECIES: molybdenum cofactor guanylyltransferase [unclassified Sphingomonas]KQM18019.1 hypothetical protein ASE50_06150 [Sphingomonas sp. Leaf5]KQM89000.1 hypothetical protein ASE73_08110 [Sphingomonas sp. Leaf24]
MTRILGAIIAGGRSSRFGSDKALAAIDGRALIDHVADAVEPQVDALIVVGRTHEGLEAVPDRPAPDLGPLGGIAAALHHACAEGFTHVLTVPCDTPFVPGDLRAQLSAAGPAAYLPDLPVVGLWPVDANTTLQAVLRGPGSRSVRAFADWIGAEPVTVEGHIANVNTQADLARLSAQRD